MRGPGRLHRAWRTKPTALTVPLIFIPIGIVVLVEGADVSQAFTLLHGTIIIRAIGALMLLGGTTVAASVTRDDALYEVLGLSLTALASAIYGIGVILGLGIHGFIAAAGYLGFTIAFLGRIALLTRSAKIASAGE